MHIDDVLSDLERKLDAEKSSAPISFRELLEITASKPEIVLRDVFQLFHDMIHYYVPEGKSDAQEDQHSFMTYDSTSLFVKNTEKPFFADMFLGARIVALADSIPNAAQQNRIYIFQGPAGSGKTTFIDALLEKFERYSATSEGTAFETVWVLDIKKLRSASSNSHVKAPFTFSDDDEKVAEKIKDRKSKKPTWQNIDEQNISLGGNELVVPCPSHDHPLLNIPTKNRREFIDRLIPDKDFKERLFSEKMYEWVFRETACTICSSMYEALRERLGSSSEALKMLYAKRYNYNRSLGRGICVESPGDVTDKKQLTDQMLQNGLNQLFEGSKIVNYTYSRLAKTNNGIYVLMDLKGHNIERFSDLHGIISDGKHRVGNIEERIRSFFIGVINPEDCDITGKNDSIKDRIVNIWAPYILDYKTEVEVYLAKFGSNIRKLFLPDVLENFAKVIISTRLGKESKVIKAWIKDAKKYEAFCDDDLLLLKMEIYSGKVPEWLDEQDRKNFNNLKKRELLRESQQEGRKGISGRQSLELFDQFLRLYAKPGRMITMDNVYNFFTEDFAEDFLDKIPNEFQSSLLFHYNYMVMQQMKESLYNYNRERISRDIQNYLFAINFDDSPDMDRKVECPFTNDTITLQETIDTVEMYLYGIKSDADSRKSSRLRIQKIYVTETLNKEIGREGKKITETKLYFLLLKRYETNLKDNVLVPLEGNPNFRRAILDYATDSFKTYDDRIREDIERLITNMQEQFGYTIKSAKHVCIYLIDSGIKRFDN